MNYFRDLAKAMAPMTPMATRPRTPGAGNPLEVVSPPPVGFLLMVVGITFPRALSTVASNMTPGPGRSVVVALMILLIAGFLVGLVAAVTGVLRNRRMYR